MLDALERDLRNVLQVWVGSEISEEELLDGFLGEANSRRLRDIAGETRGQDLLEYLHLGETVSLLNIHRKALPPSLAEAVRTHTQRLEGIVPIRNRVMHGRPLLEEDPDVAVRTATELEHTDLSLPSLRTVLNTLRTDPDWQPVGELVLEQDRVVHNLPVPEFDETGFIGRRQEAKELLRMLFDRRYPVITVLGPGGVGKTALAVKALYDLIDDPKCPYEAVLWASLKLETLTLSGLQKLREPLGDIAELAEELVRPIDETFAGSLNEMGEALEGIEALVVIDNVETASADDVITLVEAFPRSASFLLTSRVGVGQLERRLQLEPMSESDAGHLLRLFARRRGVKRLVTMPDSAIAEIISGLHHSPLAIKWYVQAVEAGQGIDAYKQGQEDLLRFCVESVIASLSPLAREVAEVLYALPNEASMSELSMHVESGIDELRSAIHELQRASVVNVAVRTEAQLIDMFGLTETALMYYSNVSRPADSMISAARKRHQEYLASEERRQADARTRRLSPNAVFTTDASQKPLANILRKALWKNKVGEVEEANSLLDKAMDLSPNYFEVHRVRGFIESTRGNLESATRSYERALELSSGEDKARVAYYYSGHLVKGCHDPMAALPHAEHTHGVLQTPETAVRLGQVLMYLRQFDRAEEILSWAVDHSEAKVRLIGVTMMIDLGKRKAEYELSEERNPTSAVRAAAQAVRLGVRVIDEGVRDYRLISAVTGAVNEGFRAAAVLDSVDEIDDDLEALVNCARLRPGWARLGPDWAYVRRHAEKMLERGHIPDRLAEQLQRDLGLEHTRTAETTPKQFGSVSRFYADKRFGFVNPDDRELGRVFVHETALDSRDLVCLMTPNARVAFRGELDVEGFRATHVSLVEEADVLRERLSGRRGTVEHKADTYFIVKDEQTSATVLVHGASIEQPWRLIDFTVGDSVSMTIEFGDRGLVAATGSVRPD